MYRKVVLTVVSLLCLSCTGSAAEIEYFPSSQINLITVTGELVSGDDKKFNNIAISTDSAVVVLISPGGLAEVGMSIGRTISIKQFGTLVPAGKTCASSCGLAWLAGKVRFLYPDSQIGFHAIFTLPDGTPNVSSSGNALVGSYLQQLGFDQRVIIYATDTQPTSMQWLTSEDAKNIGLDVELVDPANTAAAESRSFIPGASSSGTAPVATKADVPTEPKPQWNLLDYTDLPGFDLPGMPIKAESVLACQTACEANATCSAFTLNVEHKACFLKQTASEAYQFTGAISGYYGLAGKIARIGEDFGASVAFRTSKGREIVSKPLNVITGVTASWCQDQCINNPECKSFSYYPSGECHIKDVRKPTRELIGAISGIKLD